jgi:hypothetical protein
MPYIPIVYFEKLRSKAVKLLMENYRKTLEDLDISNNFLNKIPKAQEIRASIDKYACIKQKSAYQKKQLLE